MIVGNVVSHIAPWAVDALPLTSDVVANVDVAV